MLMRPLLLLALACQRSPSSAEAPAPPGLAERAPGAAAPPSAGATLEDDGALLRGQRIYVPAYSHVFSGDGQPLLLAITLSVRNTSDRAPITLREVHYLDADGRVVKEHDRGPQSIPPLGSAEFFIPERDTSGGSGASFLLTWSAEEPVSAPVVQAVHLSTRGQLGVSMVTEGRALRSWTGAAPD